MIRLGTRRSRLATAQARIVADRLEGAELVPISTEGDRDAARSFSEIGSVVPPITTKCGSSAIDPS